MAKWQISIDNFLGGYCPAYWKTEYNSYGNKNMCSKMTNIDLTNPSYLTQGTGLAIIEGTVDQLMKGILNNVMIADTSVGIGGTKVYEITSTAVTSKTIGTIAGGEDVALYGGELFYSWNTDIGKTSTAFASPDEDWWTAVAGGDALTTGKPHQTVVAGTTGVLTVLNGSKVVSWDGTNHNDAAFDTKDTDIVLVSQVWNQNNFQFAGNKPNTSGRNEGSIFIWDGSSPSWDYQIKINGKIGALFVKNGVTFVFYQKNISQGVCTLGYIDGIQIRDVANYYGSLPNFYQVCDFEDFIIWASGTSVFAWGGGDLNLNTRLFQLGTCGTGGLANPFGTPISASSTKLEKFSGYTVTSSWKSLLFDIRGVGRQGYIDELKINFEKLIDPSQCDWTLKNNKGASLKTGTISFALDGAATKKDFYPKIPTENCRIELDFASGSSTNSVKIKSITLMGHSL